MDTAVLAIKQENLLYVKWNLSENVIASYISKFVKHYYLLTVQQTVLLKIIYDFWVEISFMEKTFDWKIFDFKKTPHRYAFSIAMYSCESIWVNVLLSKGCMVAVRNYSIYKHYNWKKQIGGRR